MRNYLYELVDRLNTFIKLLGVNRYRHPNSSLFNMSEAHLGKGSTQPPKVEGLLRLYSMKFCPYAQRPRLVLNAKGIKHDIVNINLVEKPEWYFKIHKEGKVPALDTGSKVIVESLDICDYLDETYPEKPLYPSDPEARKADKELIKKMDGLTTVFAKCAFGIEKKSTVEWLKDFLAHLDVFEKELAKRGTTFFGGNSPNMVDYMLWPWGERAGCVAIALKEKLPFKDDQLQLLRKWKKEMRKVPVVDSIYIGPERFWKIAEAKLNGTMPEYDKV